MTDLYYDMTPTMDKDENQMYLDYNNNNLISMAKHFGMLIEDKIFIESRDGKSVEILNWTLNFNSVDMQSLYKGKGHGFGSFKQNNVFIAKEIKWYIDGSNKNNELTPKVWPRYADVNGYVNSNYGYLMFSPDNYYQMGNVFSKLLNNINTRQAVAHYSRPGIHYVGGKDYICTMYVNYMIRLGELHIFVHMRSNDFRKGLIGCDLAWQNWLANWVLYHLKEEGMVLKPSAKIYWNVDSLHVYEQDFDSLLSSLKEVL